MTTLFIRHPARFEGAGQPCQFALAGDGGSLMQHGALPLAGMGELVAASRRVVLILAACDVNLVEVHAPPLSGARLKAALPNLVEELVLGEPEDCVLAAGPVQGEGGQRMVAVTQRAWLAGLVKTLLDQGARSVGAVPAQLCLPLAPGGASAAITDHELAVRLGPMQGVGLALHGTPEQALQTAQALAGDAALTVYVPQTQLAAFQLLGAAVTLEAEHWAHWINGAQNAGLDLAPGLGAAGAPQHDWSRWRWPAAMAVLALLVNVVALNVEWLRLKREAAGIQQSMFTTFKAAYPKAPEPLYPLEQMRRNVAGAKAASGQQSPSEFGWQSAAVGEALRNMAQKPLVSGVEYRDGALTVKLRPESVNGPMLEQMRGMLAARGLSVAETAAATWQVRAKEGK